VCEPMWTTNRTPSPPPPVNDCKIFCVSDVYARYDPDVRGRGEGGGFKTDEVKHGGVPKTQFFVRRL